MPVAACTRRTRWRGCSPTPTPTRSACPTRACRSSTRSSTSATTPSPSAPTARGPTSPPSCARTGLPLFSVDTHRPAGDFDVLAFNLSAELVYTNVLECIDLAGIPLHAAAARRRRRRSSSPAATARSTPSRWPTSSTSPCSATARRSSARSPRCVGGVEAGRQARRVAASALLRDLAAVEGVYVPSLYECTYDGAAPRRRHAPVRRRARAGREAHDRRPRPPGRTRSSSSCRSPRSCTTGSTSRCSAAAPGAAASARPA